MRLRTSDSTISNNCDLYLHVISEKEIESHGDQDSETESANCQGTLSKC